MDSLETDTHVVDSMATADRIVAAVFVKDLSLTHSKRTVGSRQQASRPNGSAAALAGLRSHGHAGKGAWSPVVELEHRNSLLLLLVMYARRPSARAGRSCDEVVTLGERAGRRSAWHARAVWVK